MGYANKLSFWNYYKNISDDQWSVQMIYNQIIQWQKIPV